MNFFLKPIGLFVFGALSLMPFSYSLAQGAYAQGVGAPAIITATPKKQHNYSVRALPQTSNDTISAQTGSQRIMCFSSEGSPSLGGTIVIEVDELNRLTHAVILGGGNSSLVISTKPGLKTFNQNTETLTLVYSDAEKNRVNINYDWLEKSGMASVTVTNKDVNGIGGHLDIDSSVNVSADIVCELGGASSNEGD